MPRDQSDGPHGVWLCKIGQAGGLPSGSDAPMRNAVARAYRDLTGEDPEFIFSGWRHSLTESERAVVDDQLPDPEAIIAEQRKVIDDAMEVIDGATRVLHDD